MKIKLVVNALLLFLLIVPAFAAEEQPQELLNIEDLMSVSEYRAAGLSKQTPEEIKALNDWLNRFASGKLKRIYLSGPESSEIDVSGEIKKQFKERARRLTGSTKLPYKIDKIEGKVFKINKRDFEMVRSCKGFSEGDMVKFIKGSPHGVCETATIVNEESGARCEMWCEHDDEGHK